MPRYAKYASFAYRNRKTIWKGAKLAYRTARKFRRSRKRKGVLPRVQSVKSKKPRQQFFPRFTDGAQPVIAQSGEELQRHTLYSVPIKFARRAVEDDTALGANIGEAHQNRIWVTGVKICITWFNQQTSDVPIPNNVMRVHFAMLQAKEPWIEVEGAPEIAGSDFFADPAHDNSGGRTGDFVNGNTEGWDWKYDCNGINKKKWNICMHRKFDLQPRVTGSGSRPYRTMDRYFKIGKRFEYHGPGATHVTNPLFMVCWWDWKIANNGNTTQTMEMNCNTTSYFNQIV